MVYAWYRIGRVREGGEVIEDRFFVTQSSAKRMPWVACCLIIAFGSLKARCGGSL